MEDALIVAHPGAGSLTHWVGARQPPAFLRTAT